MRWGMPAAAGSLPSSLDLHIAGSLTRRDHSQSTRIMQKRMLDFSQSPESRYWRTVRGYPDYLVGVDGRIYSKPRQVTRWRAGSGRETFTQAGMFLTPMKNTTGYYQVCLTNDDNRGRGGSEKRLLVHRLVADAWVPNPSPCQFDVVNHIDGDIQNNHRDNLEWTTQEINMLHRYARSIGYKRSIDLIEAWRAGA